MWKSGDLTTSGMLYEGSDLDGWKKRTRSVFNVRANGRGSWEAACALNERTNQSQRWAIAIVSRLCEYISPAVLTRIPQTAKVDLACFWKCLPGLLRPFRFLDLNEQTRKIVYSLAFEYASEPLGTVLLDGLHPPVLSVNQQIRREATPLFFSSTTFSLQACLYGEITPGPSIHQWLELRVRDSLRLLRKLQFMIETEASDEQYLCLTIDLEISAEGVLLAQIETNDARLSEHSRGMLDDHFENERGEDAQSHGPSRRGDRYGFDEQAGALGETFPRA